MEEEAGGIALGLSEVEIDTLTKSLREKDQLDPYGIGVQLFQDISLARQYRPSIEEEILIHKNPYDQASFLPPVTCYSCGRYINFILAFSMLREGRTLEDVFIETEIEMICCRRTLMETQVVTEMISEEFMRKVENAPDEIKQFIEMEGKLTNLYNEIFLMERAGDQRVFQKIEERDIITQRLQQLLEHSLLLKDYISKEYLIETPHFTMNRFYEFMKNYNIIDSLNLVGSKQPLFNTDGFLNEGQYFISKIQIAAADKSRIMISKPNKIPLLTQLPVIEMNIQKQLVLQPPSASSIQKPSFTPTNPQSMSFQQPSFVNQSTVPQQPSGFMQPSFVNQQPSFVNQSTVSSQQIIPQQPSGFQQPSFVNQSTVSNQSTAPKQQPSFMSNQQNIPQQPSFISQQSFMSNQQNIPQQPSFMNQPIIPQQQSFISQPQNVPFQQPSFMSNQQNIPQQPSFMSNQQPFTVSNQSDPLSQMNMNDMQDFFKTF